MKTIGKFLFGVLILFAFSCSQDSTLDPLQSDFDAGSLNGVQAKASSHQTALIGGLEGIMGTSKLLRNKSGITVNFKAINLKPGAYTIWWVIWNNPEECATPGACIEDDFATPGKVGVEVMYAAGHVVGTNGKGNFSARLKAGDLPESMNTSFGFPSVGGLGVGNTFGAEVHVVLRTHGPVVPTLVSEQISSYRGGCNNPFAIPPFTSYPDAIGECADIAAAIFAPVD